MCVQKSHMSALNIASAVVTGKLGQTSKGNMSRLELTIKDKNI